MGWTAENFEIAMADAPKTVTGWTWRGLGLHQISAGYHSKNRKRTLPPQWALSHLGSGHRIIGLFGEFAHVQIVATEIAIAGDWDFLSLEGWKDRFPDAKDRLLAIVRRHPTICRAQGGASCRDVAMQIAANRP